MISFATKLEKLDGGTEKNSTKGLVTSLGRIPGEALRVITETNGSRYFTLSIDTHLRIELLLFGQ